MKIFGERVKQTLKERGETQKQLAEFLSVQRSTLYEWLNNHNEPPMEAMVKIADYLEVSIDYLFGRKDYD